MLVIRCAVVVVGSKYGVDTNCEDRVSKVGAGVVVIGNMYGVDEDSGEYDSKVVSDVGETVVEECSG